MLNLAYLERLVLPPADCVVSPRDAMLYALSIGLGQGDLAHVYEGAAGGLRVFATMPLVLGDPGPWWHDGRCGVGQGGPLHGAQSLRVYADIPLNVPLRAESRIVAVRDCRGGHGAITVERNIHRREDGMVLATGVATLLCRGDGGFGTGFARGQVAEWAPVPDEPCDAGFAVDVGTDAALLYRLNGDANPLHADPAVARSAGFAGPVLHGLASLAMAAVGLRRHVPQCGLRALAARFVGPVYPGDRLIGQVWRRGDTLHWRAWVAERMVIDRGVMRV